MSIIAMATAENQAFDEELARDETDTFVSIFVMRLAVAALAAINIIRFNLAGNKTLLNLTSKKFGKNPRFI